MADQLDEQLKKTIDAFIEADARGSSSSKEHKAKIAELRKQIEKEKTKPPPQHPALNFGPITQTVACMAITSLGLNIAGLAKRQTVYERMVLCESEMQRAMRDFAVVFVRMSIGAVAILVAYTAIILYGYQTALTSLASSKKEEKSEAEIKLAALLKGQPDRPDMWAHTRSHPSAFLSTKEVAPRIFPFPLGKTGCKAQVKEELWWEGGNPPHVGHYNRPKVAPTTAPLDEAKLVARVKKKMEIEAQRGLWSRRIQSIQILSGIAMVYFVSSTIAIIALLWLIYTTLMREIDNMLQPPTDWSAIHAYIDQISMTGARTQSAPKSDIKKRIPPGGMTYIYDPISAAEGVVNKNSNIPIVGGPAPVLMTTQNRWYAGP